MSNQFTPGPWSVEAHAFHGAYHYVTSFHPRHICRVEADDYGEPIGDVGLTNARLIAAAPDFAVAVGADLDPGENATCGPLAWLQEAIAVIERPEVKAADMAATGSDDPDAYDEMVSEVRALHRRLVAALSRATGAS